MGTFADASRRGPYLFARLAKAPRHAVGDPTVAYGRQKSSGCNIPGQKEVMGLSVEYE